MSGHNVYIAQATASTLLLIVAHVYFYRAHPSWSLKYWIIGWSLYVLRLGLGFLHETILAVSPIVVLVQITHLLSAFYLLRGGHRMENRPLPRWLIPAFATSAAWAIVAALLELPHWAISAPSALAMAAALTCLATHLMLRRDLPKIGRRVAGTGFLLWAAHMLNYPFLRPLEAYAPFGFAIASLLATVSGVGLLLVHLDHLRVISRRSERRFQQIVRSVDDIILTVGTDGVVRNVYGAWFDRHAMPRRYLPGTAVAEALPAHYREQVSEELKRVFDGETRTVTLELHVRRTAVCIAFSGSPLRDDTDSITGAVVVGRDITDYERSRQELVDRLGENRVLMQEIHHRVKNNMQVMASLLSLQSVRMLDATDQRIVEESSHRIQTMAHVHEQLYASQSFSQVEMGPYISELVRRLAHTYRSAGRRIDVRTDVQNIRLSIERAVPCAQILHELITNSLKHAFTDRDHGRVDVRMSNGDGNLITLEVRDDGSGMRPDASDAGSESLGMKLIEILSRQLDGSAAFENTNGTAFRLQFPKDNRRA